MRSTTLRLQTSRITVHFAWLIIAALGSTAAAAERIVVEGLFKDQAVLNIDGRQRILRSGQTSPEGVRLIGANSQQAVIEIAGERRTIGLGAHIAGRFAEAPEGASVSVWPDTAGMYFVDGSINAFPMRFLVDTGATLIAMNRYQARRLGIDYKLDGQIGATATASGVAKAYYVTLKRVRVGAIELRDVKAAVLDGDFPTEVLLGNSFLGKLDLERDGAELRLKKRAH